MNLSVKPDSLWGGCVPLVMDSHHNNSWHQQFRTVKNDELFCNNLGDNPTISSDDVKVTSSGNS